MPTRRRVDLTKSLSARRAWIEITTSGAPLSQTHVALRKESVDRNQNPFGCCHSVFSVALRKESVDRNYGGELCVTGKKVSLSARRAWIEISRSQSPGIPRGSLSARRAWIEIFLLPPALWAVFVALRKESVDRNPLSCASFIRLMASLSARRAWIEMLHLGLLIKEGTSRSPQGERG